MKEMKKMKMKDRSAGSASEKNEIVAVAFSGHMPILERDGEWR
jgi:hypothetical protein